MVKLTQILSLLFWAPVISLFLSSCSLSESGSRVDVSNDRSRPVAPALYFGGTGDDTLCPSGGSSITISGSGGTGTPGTVIIGPSSSDSILTPSGGSSITM